MERVLGVTLLVRGNHRVKLTEKGALLRRWAVEILGLADMVREEPESSENSMAWTIRMGCAETNAILFVARVMRTFSERHSLVDFGVHSGDAEDVSDRMDRGLVDFGIIMEPIDKAKYDFVSLPAAVRWGLLVRSDDPLSGRDALSRKTLLAGG